MIKDKWLWAGGIALLLLMFYKPGSNVQQNTVFSVSDPSADLSGVKSILITIDKVSVIGENKQIEVLQNPVTIDLLELKNSSKHIVIGQVNLTGTYNQIRLHIVAASLTKDDGTVSSLTIPSDELRFKGSIVGQDKAMVINLDFNAADSIVLANHEYIMRPVLKMEVFTNTDVRIVGNEVRTSGGQVAIMEEG